MKLFNWGKHNKEKRVNVHDERYWTQFFDKFGLTSKSGQNVTPDNALQISTVFACIKVLAESIASLPLIIYKKRKDGGKDVATDHYLYPILHNIPNTIQTSYELREMMMGHINLRGNAYAYKEIDKQGRVVRLWPLNAARMEIELKNGQLIYKYTTEEGKEEKYPSMFIWHWRGLSKDGIVGLSPITLAREALGLALSAEEHGARFFANDATPTGILKFPGKLHEDAQKKLKESWQEAQTTANKFKTAVLQGGLEWQQIGISNEDSQFLQTRQFQIEEIARIFRVPSLMINHPDKTATYASAEQFFLGFVVHTIRPWTVRLEQSMYKSLFTEEDIQQGYFAEFKIDGLLRGDIKSRYDAYAVGRNWGWLSADDIRALENMNPLPDKKGQVYLQPLNMIEAGKEPPPQPTKKTEEFSLPIRGNNGDS